jgi:hypothetical protein
VRARWASAARSSRSRTIRPRSTGTPPGSPRCSGQEVAFSHVDWPADIRFEHLGYVLPVKKLGGSLAFQVGSLSTEIDETTELQPFGTGRTFFFTDFIAGAAYARRWTDKLLVGFGAKYLHEDLGSDVGGPTTGSFLVDLGSIYYLGYGSVRIAVSLTNFGPELQPSGQFTSPTDGSVRDYDGFDAPTMFRYGVAFEPIENARMRLTTSLEASQPADDAQSIKAGVEWTYMRSLALRTGLRLQRRRAEVLGRRGLLGDVRRIAGCAGLRVHRRPFARRGQPPDAGREVLMRRLFAIGMLLAVVALTGCGTDYKLPTESPKGRAVPSDGSYQMLSTWTGMNDVQDILLTQGTSSQLFILFNHGGSGTTSRGEVRAYALTRPEVLAGYDFHVPADTPFNPVALASGGDGVAASANNRIYVLSRGDTCLARQNPNTGNCSDTTGGFRNKVTHLEYYWRVFEYHLLAGDSVSSFTDTTMAYVSGVAADAMGRVYVGGIAIVSVPSQIDPTLSERVYQSRVYRYVHGGSDPNMPGANWHRDQSWQVEEGLRRRHAAGSARPVLESRRRRRRSGALRGGLRQELDPEAERSDDEHRPVHHRRRAVGHVVAGPDGRRRRSAGLRLHRRRRQPSRAALQPARLVRAARRRREGRVGARAGRSDRRRGRRLARLRRRSGHRAGDPLQEAPMTAGTCASRARDARVRRAPWRRTSTTSTERRRRCGPCRRPAPPRPTQADSIRYGVRVTDNNLVGMTVTNYGFIGNNFISRSPSLEYPLGLGFEHLVRGGLWIGAHAVDGGGSFTGVTTGTVDGNQGTASQGATEFTPAGLEIKSLSRLPNNKFFNPNAVSELDLISNFSDRPARTSSGNEDHRPVNVLVTQNNYMWSFSDYQHVVFFHYVIKNIGTSPLGDVWVGLYGEMASGSKNSYTNWPPTSSGSALGSWFNKKWIQYDDSLRLFREHYCYAQPIPDGCMLNVAPYWMGIKLLGVTPGSVIDTTDKKITFAAWKWSPGNALRDEDVERYAIMSAGTIDPIDGNPDLVPGSGDPVEVLAVGPFAEIDPGDSVAVRLRVCRRSRDRRHPDPRTHRAARVQPRLTSCPCRRRRRGSRSSRATMRSTSTGTIRPRHSSIRRARTRATSRATASTLASSGWASTASPSSTSRRRQTTRPGSTRDSRRSGSRRPVTIDGVTYQYKYTVNNLRDGFKYYTAVTAYDLGNAEIESLESGINQNKTLAIAAPSPGEKPNTEVTVFPNPYRVEARWDAGQKVRDHYLWFANLPARCSIKIYTVSGDLVFETDFDGATYHGEGARGIYDPRRELDVDPPTLSGATVRVEHDHARRSGLPRPGSTCSRSRTRRRQAPHRQVPAREVRSGGVLVRALLRIGLAALACAAFVIAVGCSPKKVMNPNLPPETSVFVQGSVDTVSYRAHLYWFGSDADGYVVAYELRFLNPDQPADTAWIRTTKTDSVFSVFTPTGTSKPEFEVRAIDDAGLTDPTPATQSFTFSNLPPRSRASPVRARRA